MVGTILLRLTLEGNLLLLLFCEIMLVSQIHVLSVIVPLPLQITNSFWRGEESATKILVHWALKVQIYLHSPLNQLQIPLSLYKNPTEAKLLKSASWNPPSLHEVSCMPGTLAQRLAWTEQSAKP